MASGASNGPKSRKIREAMMKEVANQAFHIMYERRLRKHGLLK
jgi:hypothetical protein